MSKGRHHNHSCCQRGKKVLVVMNNGEKIVGKFIEATDKYIFLEGRKLRRGLITLFSIYKPNQFNEQLS